jgi:hypothetical protein
LSAGAADKPTPKQIAQLIEQLGSNNYEEREQATKKLAEIGMPALNALRKAAASGDPEIQKRAEELINRLDEQIKQAERRAESAKLLTASKIHLVYKDTPLTEAVADFAKKSGYTLQLHDPEKKLADRKITLDTGMVTFWQAFDQFCTAAGLTEASLQDMLVPQQRVPRLRPQRQPEDPNNPFLPGQPAPGGPADPSAPKQDVPVPGAQIQPVPPAESAAPGARIQPRPPAGGGIAPPGPVPGVQIQGAFGPVTTVAGVAGVQPSTIVLKDGKPEAAPTWYSGAVRIRAVSGNINFAVPADQLVVSVEARSEPRMQLQSITAVKITKAVDDKNQNLDQVLDPTPANVQVPGLPGGVIIWGAGIGAANRPQSFSPSPVIPVRLKKAANGSKTLKELSGTLTAQALLAPEPLITVDNILKATGKTLKGKDGTTLKVIEANMMDDGSFRLRVQIDSPAGAGAPLPQIQFQIIPANPVPIPLPQPIPLPNGGIFQIQPQPVPAGRIQKIQIGQIGGGIVPPNFNRAIDGLKLLDDKGLVIPGTQSGIEHRWMAGGQQPNIIYTLSYKLRQGQEPSKLVYTAGRSVTFDIPFTLKDVPVK